MFYPNLLGLITFSGAFLLMILTMPCWSTKTNTFYVCKPDELTLHLTWTKIGTVG